MKRFVYSFFMVLAAVGGVCIACFLGYTGVRFLYTVAYFIFPYQSIAISLVAIALILVARYLRPCFVRPKTFRRGFQ